MPRPRAHDMDRVLDAVEHLCLQAGPAAVTVRALSDATSVSNGALYHSFGSRAGLLGSTWLRAADRFLRLQRDAAYVSCDSDDGTDAVVAAALCPATFLQTAPASARFLLTVSRADLLRSGEVPADVADALSRLDDSVTELLVTLSQRLWGRRDARAVAVVRTCVVDLPTALLLRGESQRDPDDRDPDDTARLAAAVRAVLSIPPGRRRRPAQLPTSERTSHR